MSDYFHTLVNQLHEHHMLCDPPYVHGLLTGFATGAEDASAASASTSKT